MATARKIRMGMVGGGRDAFIGAVHRMAAQLDGEIEFVAGALSSTPEKSLQSGRGLGLKDERNYPTWQAMIEGETRRRDDRIDFVTIVTPNESHYEIARGFAEAGIHLVIDKPMVTTVQDAESLEQILKQQNIQCCVTYNYSGYPLVKQARELVRTGELGDIRKIIVEYSQGWLATRLEDSKQKQALWRADPQLAGTGGAIADIGSHAEQLASFVTGLKIHSICADLSSLVAGRKLDDDANILLRFANGARGVLIASQVCVGERNNLRLRVWGSKAGLEWHQENPNQLVFKPLDSPPRIFHAGESHLSVIAKRATRLPPGHPEGFIEAFANLYRAFAERLRCAESDLSYARSADGNDASALDFPTIEDGVRGVKFIHAAIESSRRGGAWMPL